MGRIKVAPKMFDNADHDILHASINTETILTQPSKKFQHSAQVVKILLIEVIFKVCHIHLYYTDFITAYMI